MAENLRKGTPIVFADGKERVVYPVSLRLLRELNKTMEGLNLEEESLSDDTILKMIDTAVVVFKQVDPKIAEDRDKVEDLVDVVSFNIMVAAAMGADPNVLAELQNPATD